MEYRGKLKDPILDKLFEAILQLENTDECYRFFEDLCTVAEIKSMGQRLEVAKMLEENKTYSDIVNKTGASTATVSRVKRALNYGADGYKLVLDRLKEKRGDNVNQ
ncbi:MAG: YerC/YecD family TrpR-related protein [Bacillota bacterium]